MNWQRAKILLEQTRDYVKLPNINVKGLKQLQINNFILTSKILVDIIKTEFI